MFYSRSLLSRKGPLGAIWVAAYCFKRLKKAQVFETNIPSSVDEILEEELDVMTYRVLAYLLLGLVRIYSKKVEYLFDDCNDAVVKINNFLVSEKSMKNLGNLCAPYCSITLPESFELDAFDLEILEDMSGENAVPLEQITLKDGASAAAGKGHYSLSKYCCKEYAAWDDSFSGDYSPADDIFSSHLMEIGMAVSATYSNLNANMENLQSNNDGGVTEPIEPVGEKHQTNEDMKAAETAQSEKRLEKLQDNSFQGVEEESLDPIKLCGKDHRSDGEQTMVPDIAQLEKETCQATSKDINKNITMLQASTEKLCEHEVPQVCSGVEMCYGSKEELPKQVELSGEEHHSNTEQMKVMEISSRNNECQVMKREDPLSVTVDATPQSKFLDASGATTPEFIVVQTPATKECARISRKRKCCFDDVTVFPNDVMRQCIQDASDLVSKRRKVPRTVLAAWKASRISNLSQGFLLPLLPCISLELRAFLCQERLKIPETAKSVELLEPELPTVHKSLEKMAITSGTPIGRSSQNMGIAPNTRTGISLEKTAVAPGTPTGRSSEKMVVAPETPTGGSSEKMVVAPETPTDGSSEKMVVAPETPTCRSPEKRAFAPDTPTGRSSEKMAVAPATPTGRSSETMAIAPDTLTVKSSELIAMTIESPIFLSVPSRSFETPENAHSIAVETLADSYATPEKDLASSKDEDFDLIFMNEESNFGEVDRQESYGFSARTRMVAKYLHRRFSCHKERREDEAIKLLPLLEGRTVKETARIFYEILVLQTKGIVNVKQDDAYGDILVVKAPWWDQSCGAL